MCSLSRMSVQHTIRGKTLNDQLVDDTVPLEKSNDAYHLRGSDNRLNRCSTHDTRCRAAAHCDDIQIIPEGLEPNAQYFGAIAHNNIIESGYLKSNGSMQGVFASDGAHVDLMITNRTIDTESPHEISISGVLSATFTGNRRSDGSPVRIFLDSLRLGGGLPNSFYVLSFVDRVYEAVAADQPVIDMRRIPWRTGKRYVENFDIGLWRAISESFADEYNDAPKDERIQSHFNKVLAEYERLDTAMFDNAEQEAIAELMGSQNVHVLTLDRFTSDTTTTISRLYLDDKFVCHILEDAYHPQKIKGRTRIPSGRYDVGMRNVGGFNNRYSIDKRFKEFHQGMLEIKDVPNFEYILFHVGNDHEDTRGCLLTGNWHKKSNTVRKSAVTYKRFYEKVISYAQQNNLVIEIEDNDR